MGAGWKRPAAGPTSLSRPGVGPAGGAPTSTPCSGSDCPPASPRRFPPPAPGSAEGSWPDWGRSGSPACAAARGLVPPRSHPPDRRSIAANASLRTSAHIRSNCADRLSRSAYRQETPATPPFPNENLPLEPDAAKRPVDLKLYIDGSVALSRVSRKLEYIRQQNGPLIVQ